MGKMLYFKNEAKTLKNKRFIFDLSPAKLEQAASGVIVPKSLAEQKAEKFNTELNVETKFNADWNEVFLQLAMQAIRKNPALSPKSLMDNFSGTLENGQNMQTAWNFLQSRNCRTVAIKNGFFIFHDGSSEIPLQDFFKGHEGKAEDAETTPLFEQSASQIHANTRSELSNLLANLRVAHKGNLPEKPTKSV